MRTDEKTGLRERIGAAVNAQDLSCIEGERGALDLVAALGLTQINPGAQEHARTEVVEIDPNARLGALLIRIKAGRQYREGELAVELLVHWIREQPKFFGMRKIGLRRARQKGPGLLHGFVRQAFAEWVWPVCPVCKGADWDGKRASDMITRRHLCPECRGGLRILARTERGKLYRKACPRCSSLGFILRDELQGLRPKTCFACRGTGYRLIDDAERARALGVSLEIYARHWIRRFVWVHERLDRLDAHEHNLLHSACDRRINIVP
jgi:uncharacterized protein YbaR (Trm112 family)